MPTATATKPVGDSVPMVNNEIAVGSDLEFQERWWKFENATWIFFGIILLLDILGCFGRGPVANARAQSSDGTLDLRYERIERFSSPSVLTIQFGANAVHDGKVKLWASESLVKPLGNQRVIPQPESSTVGGGGILYTFAVSTLPASVEFALEPSKPGLNELTFRVPGFDPVAVKIFVMP